MKKNSLYSLGSLLVIAQFLVAAQARSQTMPVPHNLASGNFQFYYWDSLSTAGSYPASMIFQFVPSNHIAPFYDDSASDYSCAYNLNKRPRINGYRSKGIGLLSTSNSQYNDCSSGVAEKKFIGSVLLAVNTLERQNIKVQWKSETLVPGDGNGTPTNPRVWRLRFQYRVGETGNFTDVPGPVEFVSGLTTGDSVSFGPTSLPAACNNKALVQLRWIYYESSAGNLGTRPRLRLDDIIVSSENLVGINEAKTSSLLIYPNPANAFFTIEVSQTEPSILRIWNQQGKLVQEKLLDNYSTAIDCSGFPRGLYWIQWIGHQEAVKGTGKILLQ